MDDNRYFSYPYDGPATWTFDTPCHIKLNLAIGGDWGGQKGVDESSLPQRFVIDYVRVYQKPNWPRMQW